VKIADIRANAYSMPFASPAYPPGPYHFKNREFLIITYRTDIDALRAIVPEPLTVKDPLVSFEFIHMPDSSGFGHYTESGQVVSVIDQDGKAASYTHMMYLNDHAPIAGGRELWGFPKKLANPHLEVASDTLIGTLDYGPLRVANGTMGFKYQTLDIAAEQAKMSQTPNYLLKIIPHVDGNPRICELVRYFTQNVTVHGAWTGPARLELFHHALAPVADLPVLEVVGAKHLICDLSLGLGEVAFDYLKA
jgi:acetoacetate decarboxylase